MLADAVDEGTATWTSEASTLPLVDIKSAKGEHPAPM